MENEYENDTFVVFDNWSGRIMGIYSELVDAMDRIDDLKTSGVEGSVEAYIRDMDVDYHEDEEEEVVD